MAATAAHGVGVHASNAGVWKRSGHVVFQTLRAAAADGQAGRAAFTAGGSDADYPAATVTDPAAARLMEGEREVALRTGHGVAAGVTLHVRGEPTTVEQEDDLATGVECPANARFESRSEAPGPTRWPVAEIDSEHAG